MAKNMTTNADAETETYDLVFKGELVKGVELDLAKRNIGQLFKIDAAKVEKLFSGSATVLKKGLNFEAASRYRVAIKKAGARVDLKPCGAVPPRAAGKAQFGPASESQATTSTVPSQVKPSAETIATGFSLAPAGSDLLSPAEKMQQEPVVVDTSAISVRAQQGNLLDEEEYQQVVSLPLDLDGYDLAEVGTDVLRPEERAPDVRADVDISGLSLGPVGERLAPKKAAPPPPPDVSAIHLVGE